MLTTLCPIVNYPLSKYTKSDKVDEGDVQPTNYSHLNRMSVVKNSKIP